MHKSNILFEILGIQSDRKALKRIVEKTSIPLARLKYYNEQNILPSGKDLESIVAVAEIDEYELMLKMGILDYRLVDALQKNTDKILPIVKKNLSAARNKEIHDVKPIYKTKYGELYQCDSLDLMRSMDNDSVDLVFADPPFNLNKLYPSNIDDALKKEKYIQWSYQWIEESIRILKYGGAFFLWNLPKWNAIFSNYLSNRLNFRHWISVDIKYSLPIQGRLYPSHYSLLYYIKGERPNTFSPDRLPMQTCPSCYADLKDYGGYKDKMNPKGINLTDVWLDIPPVRHAKYKRRKGANELSLKLMDRIIEMSSKKGDIIFDPFGGAGTTYIAAELKERKWIGAEIGPIDDIINRFSRIEDERKILKEYRENYNKLFTDKVMAKRHKLGLWTNETIK